jgi:thioredoxin-like negative regulator of GroEL
VDAYVNSDLKKYLQGGYPTVRTFVQGQLGSHSFVGSKSESYVRQFIDSVINQQPMEAEEVRGELKELKTSKEFNELIAQSQVPVLVKFSAEW